MGRERSLNVAEYTLFGFSFIPGDVRGAMRLYDMTLSYYARFTPSEILKIEHLIFHYIRSV